MKAVQLLTIRTAGLVCLLMLMACCSFVATRKFRVRDVEGRPATSSRQTQGKGEGEGEPALPPQALTKEEVLGVDAAYEWEPSPPPYYPVRRFSFIAKERKKFTCAFHVLWR